MVEEPGVSVVDPPTPFSALGGGRERGKKVPRRRPAGRSSYAGSGDQVGDLPLQLGGFAVDGEHPLEPTAT
jgi:hypothetical protein